MNCMLCVKLGGHSPNKTYILENTMSGELPGGGATTLAALDASTAFVDD